MANSNWADNALKALNAGATKPEPQCFTADQMKAAFQAGYDHAHAEAEAQMRQLLARPLAFTGTFHGKRMSAPVPNAANIPRRDYNGGKHK